ncbi:MAG: hypothetical protein WCS28_01270, partial [Thiomicrospira sp.]
LAAEEAARLAAEEAARLAAEEAARLAAEEAARLAAEEAARLAAEEAARLAAEEAARLAAEEAARLAADEAARLAAEEAAAATQLANADEVKRDAIANAQQQAATAESATKTTQAVTNVNVEQLIQLVANAPLTSTDFNGVSTTRSGDFNLVFVSTDTLSASLDEKGIVDVNLDDMSSLMRFLEANNLLEQGRLVVVNNGIRLPFLLTRQDVNF